MRFQEIQKFTQFANSLLSKSAKLSDLMPDLERALEESGRSESSTDGKRVEKFYTQVFQCQITI